MIAAWAAVEADFAQHYGIDLMERIDSVSWRWFTVRLRGLLSADTATRTLLTGRQRPGGPAQFEGWLRDHAKRQPGSR
ncbi:MAG TPA: hypothetical protein VFV01_47760 [Spirillospora sp.]|nr:hypothetical protein [Spirillospora sp.]